MDAQKLIPISAFDQLSEAVAVADAGGRLLFVNQQFALRYNITTIHIAKPKTDWAKSFGTALSAAFASAPGLWEGAFTGPDGVSIPLKLNLIQIHNDGVLSHVLAVAQSDTQAQNGAVPASNKDPLTGFPVRAFLSDRIEHAVQTQKRHGGSVVLMVLGLDHFTLVNDAYGLAAGDSLLAASADRIRTCIRESDSAFRLDGDKFGILLTVTAPDDVIIVAEKVLMLMREPYHIRDQEVNITTSVGIAAYPGDTEDVGQLIQITENSLHHAKELGRNQYQFFSKDMNGKAITRLSMASRIRKAISNDEFIVHYQPKVRSDDHTILGAEALARWQDPELGLIQPNDCIPVAEETGLIEAIGLRVLEKTCRQGKKWLDAGYDPITLSVNVSPRQFRNTKFVDTVKGLLDDTGLPPEWLELEITESMIMVDMEGTARKMQALRDYGLKLSIDDFGTGYSSLSYLGNFPLTSLKIDKAFVTDVDTNPKTAEIARAIIGLSKGLKLDVVAEGCEIPEHLKFLKDHGCDAIQGFYFSKAVPPNEFEAMLRAGMVYPVPTTSLFP